jgi:hypothetical protein
MGAVTDIWIDRGGPITWPPKSPDLTPLDSFLWGYAKNIVYQVKTNDLQHLNARTRDTVAMVTPSMLQATWNEVEHHLDICCATRKPTLKFIEKVTYSEKKIDSFPL